MGTPPPDVDELEYRYTTRDEMDSVYSEFGVQTRVDDLYSDKGSVAYLDDIIDDATEIINQYLAPRYLEEDLYRSRWVRRRCTWIACHLLSLRRGNPRQFTRIYDDTIVNLERCMRGEFNVPRLALRSVFEPTFSNLVIDYRYPSPPQSKAARRGRLW